MASAAALLPRVSTPARLLAAALDLRPGQDIVIAQGYGQPRTLVRALARHGERLRGSRLFFGMLVEDLPDVDAAQITTFFPS